MDSHVIRSRVQHDENAAPVNAKSLHHRHKSMIALPSESKIPVDHRQGLRRTAFGQLNTNAANLQRSRDDSSIKLLAGKQDAPLATQLRDFKPLLERPAHRPFSVAGLKSLLSSGSSKPILQDSASHPGVITNDTQKPLPYTANEAIRAASMSDPSDRIDFQIHEDEAIDKSGPLVPSMTRRPLQNALPTSLILDSGDSWLVSITQSIKACEESSSASDLPPLPPAHAIQPTGSRDEPILIDSQLSVHSSCVAPTISDPEDQISTSSGPLTEQPIDRPSSPVFLQEILEEDEPVSESKATALVVAAPAQKPVDEEVLRAVQRRADCPSPPASVNDGENDNVERHAWAPHDFPDGTLRPIFNDRVFAELEAACDAMDEVERSQEDEDEDWDITLVSEYSDDIFAYMRTLETDMTPNPTYMDAQTEIQWPMRTVLIDWIVQVHQRFSMVPETLFLTINLIDRFLSVKVVSLAKLQLVGAAAIYLAAKYEEINCPTVAEMVFMVDRGFSADEILKAEKFMLNMLRFELGWPGPMSFLRRISKADDYHLETRTLAKYLMELTVMDERFIACPPSSIAAAAHYLARQLLRLPGANKQQPGTASSSTSGSEAAAIRWTIPHVYYSGYTEDQILPIADEMLDCCRDGRTHHRAVFDKYKVSRFHQASTFVEGELRAGFRLEALDLLDVDELYGEFTDGLEGEHLDGLGVGGPLLWDFESVKGGEQGLLVGGA